MKHYTQHSIAEEMHLVIITRDIDYRTDYLSKSYDWTPKKVRNRKKNEKARYTGYGLAWRKTCRSRRRLRMKAQE